MNPRSMLKRIQSKQRLGEYRGKVEFRQKLKTEAKSLDNAQQRLNEIIAESDEQLLKKKKRMNLLGNVGRAIGAGVAAATGAGLLAGAAYYAIGGKLGSEVGQNIASKKSRRLEEEEQEELKMERALSVAGAAEQIANPMQQLAMMQQLASTGTLDSYYSATIEGGSYEDTIELKDTEIKDNYKALRNLAQDKLHRTIVRSQYNK